ncbi:MAG: HAMP domain-containing sensor histidine kinase, partial [Pseudomonadota bacterium]
RRGASYDTIMAEASRSVRVERPISSQGDAREMLLMSEKWISFVDRKTAGGGLISVGLDVTPMKRHEADLSAKEKSLRRLVTDLDRSQGQAEELAKRAQEATAKAERASRSKSVFLANMSHELRTPLNAINGFSEMLVKELYGPLGDDRYKGYAEDILQSGQHLLDMINDILDMAKIEAGKMSISPRQIDPIEAVDAAVRMIRRRALDKQIELTLHANGDLPEIEGDHRAIKQMVLNLVSNAIKFTDPGGKIDVTAETEDRFIAVRVKDSGIGIPAEDLPRLAQPFEQASADETRNSQGTGLGLALTKSFAEMHGGHLTIESVVGEGTTVAFFLPIEQGPRTQKTNDKVRAA